jgi:selenocysteine lyase/cysteine desulfurase
MSIDDVIARSDDEPGYLDFARIAPIGRAALEEQTALGESLARARYGSLDVLGSQHDRLRRAAAALTGFRPDQIVFQPNTSEGLLHTMFGITGAVALSAQEYPALTYAVTRAAATMGVLTPLWVETDHGRVTPGNLRTQLAGNEVAVAVSLVDHRTGYLADLEGIRQVIGDRLLIVDAAQGFGVVDVPWELADVIATTGRKWTRAGTGTGLLALSDRALEHLTPVWSGYVGDLSDDGDAVPDPPSGADAFQASDPDPIAAARFAAALEELESVGVAAVNSAIAERVSRLIEIADEFALPVVSPRAEPERAGIVVVEPEPDRLTALTASLHNHGVSATTRGSTVRLSAHVSTDEETFAMLRAALVSFATI